jgi:hypothetical protein
MGEKGVLSSAQKGAVRHYGRDGISSYTDGTQLHGAGGRIDLAGSQVHFNSVFASEVWGPKWLNADAVGIKVTEGLIDIDINDPLLRGEKNKVDNRTTVSDFVTHEPYDRQSSTQRKKAFINEAMAEVKKSNPELSASDLKAIKTELSKEKSVKAVADKLGKIAKLSDDVKIEVDKVKDLISKADSIQKLIDNPKQSAINFVSGLVSSYTGRAVIRNTLRKVKRFFTGPQGRDPDDIA